MTATTTEASDQLLAWFRAHGGFLHDDLKVEYDSVGVYGYVVRAGQGLAAGATACRCPVELTLSHLNATGTAGVRRLEPHGCGAALAAASGVGPLSGAAVGAFVVTEQRLRGADSFWHQYLAALPGEEELTTPLYFDASDLVWLWGTNLYADPDAAEQSVVEQRRAQWREQWARGVAALEAAGLEATPFTWELFQWAATIMSSRCFGTNMEGSRGEPILYPVMDLFNHRFREPVSWDFQDGTFSLALSGEVTTGVQVFNNYGPKSNEELLLGYGFCTDSNVSDQVAVRLAQPSAAVYAELQQDFPSLFGGKDWIKEGIFYLRGRDHHAGGHGSVPGLVGVPMGLVVTLRAVIGAATAGLSEAERWWAALDQLEDRLRHQLATIVQWDERLPAGGPQNRRQVAAKLYRDGQVAILGEVVDAIECLLQPLEEGEVEVDEVFGALSSTPVIE